ncbi:N-acetylmuramoyl-L-alanine amidase [Desulfocicer vacuolatum]|uniref:N-acetylmuramoyl-L-alanine amidase n=1 Tax=Desulfocicer vacuolatum TaxID=2298 RepID=UPI001E47F0EA|nr:N-acetylmuramoyl-L-alanine amidase [Desulfocicer vacuolatum]
MLFLISTAWCITPAAQLDAATAKAQYLSGNRAVRALEKRPEKQAFRENWMKCIDKFQRIFLTMPNSEWAAAAMYRSGQLFLELHKHSYSTQDKQEAIDLLQRVTRRYPRSAYKKRALALLTSLDLTGKNAGKPDPKVSSSALRGKIPHKKAMKYKTIKQVVQKPTHKPGTNALITGIRHWSNPSYTRVVIDLEQDRKFSHALLEKNTTLNKPQRLFVDIQDSRLARKLPKQTYINDHLLTKIRAAQHDLQSVRVVMDIKSFDNYKIFSLKDPCRVVVDVWAKKEQQVASSTHVLPRKPSNGTTKDSLVHQLALGVKTIVIDPGHGGKDPGAGGYQAGVQEKNVVLSMAKKLAKKMKSRLKCNVIMTRTKDKFLSLEKRTAIANTQNADLFISLHCNAAENKKLAGVETYFLNLATDDEAINVAARENATSKKNISDLQSILNDLMKNAKINESGRLAKHVQKAICTGLSKKYSNIHNLGVKQAPFYVLLGASMPSILVETSFISNKLECKRLLQSSYQNRICDGIIDGVAAYIKETAPGKS